jgi:hypothetical protein
LTKNKAHSIKPRSSNSPDLAEYKKMNYKLIMKNFIEKKSKLKTLLNKLNGNEKPEFGLMTPQHMIEHLHYQ